jgi:serine/threonine protein phosphatase PrpC
MVKFAVKAQGASHIEKGTPCQDAVTAYLNRNNSVGIACVADGHGGSKYFRSDKGSIMAVQVAERALFDFCGTIAREKKAFYNRKEHCEDTKSTDTLAKLKGLEGNIIYNWRNAVMQHLEENPFTEDETEFCKKNDIAIDDPANLLFVYGSTLLAGLVSESFWFVIQIGDGLCVVIENQDEITIPIEEDERLAFGRTTSLCDNNAIENFREACGFTAIEGLTVATDGMSDSFEPEKYMQFNKDLYEKFTHFPVKAETELQEFLPELSERGSRDDVSMAGIFRMSNKRELV